MHMIRKTLFRIVSRMVSTLSDNKLYDPALFDLIPKNQYDYVPKGQYVSGPVNSFLLVPKNRYRIALLPGQERKSDCGIGWLTEDNTPEGYDLLWGDPDALEKFRTENDGVRDRLAKEIVAHIIADIPDECALVDIGCGVGDLLEEIRALRPQVRLAGCDFSSKAIQAARLRMPDGTFSIQTIETEVDYPDNSFDVVLCTDVLEHLDYPKRVIGELLRICRPGGFVALVVPDGDVDLFLGHNWFWNLEQFGTFLEEWKPVVRQMPETKELIATIKK